MKVLRTPEDRFADLPGFGYSPVPASVVIQSVAGFTFLIAAPAPRYTDPPANHTPPTFPTFTRVARAGPPAPPATVEMTPGPTRAGRAPPRCAAAAAGPMAGILKYSTVPIVSRDVIGDSESCVFDAPLTQASGPLGKVFGWYDNEWGYSVRTADIVARVGKML